MSSPSYMARFGARLADTGFSIIPIIPQTKAPGQFRGGRWVGYREWSRHAERTTKAFEVDIWCRWPGAGIGVVCGGSRVVALDIDVMDADAVGRIEALAQKKLGFSTAVRIGQLPKKLLVYRTEKPFRSIKCHPLEFLAHGSQFVAYADHPATGQPYQWPLDSLVDMQLSDLPVITEEQAREFLAEAVEMVPPELRRTSLRGNALRRVEAYYQAGSDLVGTPEAVEDALQHIPNDLSYDDWIDIGLAIKAAIGEAGRSMWCEWSRRSSKSGNSGSTDTPERKWTTFNPHSIGAGTIYEHAMRHGWVCPPHMTMNGIMAALASSSIEHPAAGLLNKLNGHAPHDEPEAEPKAPSTVIEDILGGAGGLLAEMVDWMCRTAIYPQPWLALGASIVAIGTAAGRRFAGPADIRTNVYCISIAESGSGKEHQLTCLNNAFFAANMVEYFAGEEIASGTAIESTMARRAVQLFQIDEFGYFMRSVLNPRATSSHRRDVLVKLTKYTGAATRLVKGTEYANKKERERVDVHEPCMCLYGTTVATPLWEAFGSGALNDGSVARMLFFQSPRNYPDHQKPSEFARDVPTSISDGLRWVAAGENHSASFGFETAKSLALDGANRPALVRVEFDHTAEAFSDELANEQLRLKREHELSEFAPVMARWLEHINRLALIRAVSGNPVGTVITVPDLEWARLLVDHCIGTLITEARRYIADNEHEAKIKRVLNIIRKHGRMTGNELARKTQFLSRRDRAEALTQLAESGVILYSTAPSTSGRPGYVVELVNSNE